MTYLFFKFGDGYVTILRLLWDGKVLNVLREDEKEEIERLKQTYLVKILTLQGII